MNYAELIICTVWHENFTWNLIYSVMVSGKTVKLKYVNYRVYGNLLYITMTSRRKLGFRRIKILSIFHLYDLEANHKILLL